MEIDKSKPVMVSGATGYVAGWIVKKLLDEGINVHAAVRNPDNKEKLAHLDAMAEKSSASITYFKADLLQEGSYDAAMEGCELVYHTASPFFLNAKDPQKDFIEPALKGTQNILNSVNRRQSVKRVVLTSSCAAIYGDAVDIQNLPNQTLTEENWNTTSNVSHNAYSYSKTLAEREAWKISKTQSRWDLVVMNPSFVLGPGTKPEATSGSFDIMVQMGQGKMKMGCPGMYIGAIDVRDLAEAHFRGGYTPSAKGRHIISAENTGILEIADHLRPKYGDTYKLPKKHLPKWLFWLMAPAAGISRKEAMGTHNHPWKADNSKSIKELGMKYRPIKDSVNEMFQQLIDSGQI